MNSNRCHTSLRWPSLISITIMVIAVLAMFPSQNAFAANFTVKNNCSYTVYPGIYPQTYSNGGWTMAPGSSVSFTLANLWNGRIWGRKGCNGASPAVCTTGSCGGTGLQCAGTTGVAGTSLAEFNLDASGTDWYDVSYVDGFDIPIGVVISNTSCVSPNTCTTAPLTSCYSGDLTDGGQQCNSPCTATGLPQYCCAGAYNTPATCQAGGTAQSPNWPSQYLSYLTTIHSACPNEYAYAYDDNVGLHTCATGSNYTVTFCPNGSGSTGGGGTEGPYGGTAAAVPGTVMAENYDTGGQGTGYSVASTNGSANNYRSDGVDLEAASSPATGNDLGWSAGGQWFRYTVNVPTAGAYKVSILVAAESAIGDAFHISNSSGSNLSGSVAVPNTGGWQTWKTVTANVTLPAGKQTLTLSEDAAGWNIDSMVFASSGAGGHTITNGATYTLQNQASQLMLDNYCDGCSGAATNGVQVIQYPANGMATQKWTLHSQGNGYYTMVNLQSGFCLDDPWGNGTPSRTLPQVAGTSTMLWQQPCNGNAAQNFEFILQGNGDFVIENQAATTNHGSAMVIDDYYGEATQGLQMWLSTANGMSPQNWLATSQ